MGKGVGPDAGRRRGLLHGEWAGLIAIQGRSLLLWGGACCWLGRGLFLCSEGVGLFGMGGVCTHSGDFRDGDRRPGGWGHLGHLSLKTQHGDRGAVG